MLELHNNDNGNDDSVKMMKNEMLNHVKNHSLSATNNKKFGDKFGTIGRLEHFDQLKKAFGAISVAIGDVADARRELLGDAPGMGGAKLLERLENTKQGVIVPSKALLADRSSKVKNVDKEVRAFENAKGKAGKAASAAVKKRIKDASKHGEDPPNGTPEQAYEKAIQAIDMPESLLDARTALSSTDSLVDETLLLYEEGRVLDMQLFLEDFVRREIQWHARAVEILSPLISDFREIDYKSAANDLQGRLESVRITDKDRELNDAEAKSKSAEKREEGDRDDGKVSK